MTPRLAATLICGIVCMALVAACGDDAGDDVATPTATAGPDYVATANARLANCPGARAACVQGADAEIAFAPPSDVGIITRAGIYEAHTCPAPEASEGINPLEAICTGKAPGDTVEALPVGRLQSEGFVVDRVGFRAFLEQWLAAVKAPPAFTALGCPVVDGDRIDCNDGYVLVFTGPVTDGVGELLLVSIDRDARGALGVSTALTGIFDTGDPGFNKELVLGGDVDWFPARSGQTPTRYSAISPPGG